MKLSNVKNIWSATLAKLVAPMEPERASKGISSLVAMLPESLPDAAFTMDSARHVATDGWRGVGGETGPLNRVPTYGELEYCLTKWWGKKRELAQLKAETAGLPRIGGHPTQHARLPDREPTAAEVEHRRAEHEATLAALPEPLAEALDQLGHRLKKVAYAPGVSPQVSPEEQAAIARRVTRGPPPKTSRLTEKALAMEYEKAGIPNPRSNYPREQP